jgi:hypothetical protein
MIFLLDLSRRFIEVEVVGGEAEQGREADFWMLSSPPFYHLPFGHRAVRDEGNKTVGGRSKR